MEWKKALAPHKWKVSISLIPLILFILMYFGVHILGDNPFSLITTFIFAIISIPFVPILKNIGFGYPDRWFVPLTDGGLFIVGLLWGVVIYLIWSIFSGINKNNSVKIQ